MNRQIWLLFTITSLLSQMLLSNTINVPADFPTIQQAIDASVNGDTVLVSPGTYVENIDFNGKAITVKSSQGAETTLIDGKDPVDPFIACVVYFHNNEDIDSILEGFTLTNGTGRYYSADLRLCGGGICCEDSSPTITNNKVYDNHVSTEYTPGAYGGGICCIGTASPVIINNEISNNSSGGYETGAKGGGICCLDDSFPFISYNNINNNHSTCFGHTWQYGYGGGIFSESKPIIANNIIRSNTVRADAWHQCGGGGIAGSGIINDNIISNNQAIQCYGGGIFGGNIIKNNVISNNSSLGGGGIYDCTFNACNIIYSNNATYGGGVGGYTGSQIILNNTIVDNIANYGGAIYCNTSSNITVVNSILWNNNKNGYEIYLSKNHPYFYPIFNISYSNVEGGSSYVYIDPGCMVTWGPNIMKLDPVFIDEIERDYHIGYLSPCRDYGTNTISNLPRYDFEGDPRIAHGKVDVGADEFYTHLYVTGNKTPSGSIEVKFVGLPGTTPVGLFVGRKTLFYPTNTMWGEFWLQAPWELLGPLGSIPADGVMVLPTTLPPGMTVPVDVPMQALIGLNPDSLSNLCVLEVR